MPRFIVLRGSRPQMRRESDRAGFRSGVLVDGEPVAVFHNRRQANRAIERTEAAARRFADPVCGVDFRDSPLWASLFSPDPFTVVPAVLIESDGTTLPETVAETIGAEKPARVRRAALTGELFAVS